MTSAAVREKVVLPEARRRHQRAGKSRTRWTSGSTASIRRSAEIHFAALEVFKGLGCTVEEVDVGWNWGVNNAWMTYWTVLFAGLLGDKLPRWRYEMTGWARTNDREWIGAERRSFLSDQPVRGEMYKTLGPILENSPCPDLSDDRAAVGQARSRREQPELYHRRRKVPASIGWYMTMPFNLVSQCPVIAVPTGFAASGIPTGMQIVGKTFDD